MFAVDQLIKRIRALKDALSDNSIVTKVTKENDYVIIDMNTSQLYDRGINAKGVEIADYAPYSPITIQIKRLKGQPTNRVTLRDTGDFYQSFYIEYKEEYFCVSAKDWKTEQLIRKYGRTILGLTEDNLKELIEQYVYPQMIDETKKIIYE